MKLCIINLILFCTSMNIILILIEMAAAAPEHTVDIDLQRIIDSAPTWTPLYIPFDSIVSKVNSGNLWMDPEHQREIVHTSEWQGEIIVSALTEGCIPEVYFDKFTKDDGCVVKRSLDGKQRCMAVYNFMTNNISFPKKTEDERLKEAAGKYYKDLSPRMRSIIDNLNIQAKVSERTLTNDEIWRFFNKRQVSKKTNLGEFLNSCLSSYARKFLNTLIKQPETKKLFDQYNTLSGANTKRNGDLATAGECLYYKVHENSSISVKANLIKKWWSEVTEHTITPAIQRSFKKTLIETLTFMVQNQTKGGKSMIMPIFAYIHTYGITPQLTAYFKDRKEFSTLVGGDHGAIEVRFQELVKLHDS